MASIEIRTTQNVTIEYELASLRDRFFAFFADLVIYYLAYYLLWMILVSVFDGAITQWGISFIGMLNVVGLLFYHLLSEVFANGQSLGKKALSLKVVRLDGQEPGL
ncbi:MAG: RDD family protein, partial [Saprospiraceae bacterium]